MSFAIIETGGKQYKVSASNILKIERLDVAKGKKVEFKKVLLVNDDKTTEVGNPTVSGATVEGQQVHDGDVARMAYQRGYKVSARVHTYLWGNLIGV